MSIRFLALIVVYGADPICTASLSSLRANAFPKSRLRTIIWDNSPQPIANTDELRRLGLIYRSTPDNISLSRIYNHVISNDLRADEHLILLDHDTELPITFLATASEAIRKDPDIDLFLPMVHAHGNWVSPLDYLLGWGRYWRAPRKGRIKARGTSAINSGMVISARYLAMRNVYDEKLRFYGTDTQFMLDYADCRNELVVLDLQLKHDLSFFSDSVTQRSQKFAAMRAAYKHIYGRRSLMQRIGVASVMTAVSMLYAWRYQSLSFLRRIK